MAYDNAGPCHLYTPIDDYTYVTKLSDKLYNRGYINIFALYQLRRIRYFGTLISYGLL